MAAPIPRWRDPAYMGDETMKREDRKNLRKQPELSPENFRKLEPVAQLAQLRGLRVERLFTVERDAIDKEARTAWLSIASEQPYERWWGVEVLDLKKESIRDGRLKSGAPLLVGHDTADQVGVVERHEITLDKKLRILARFGRSQRAEEIFQDVLDGIRRNTSVGYIIHDLVLEKQEEDVCTYRVTDWEPLEGSLVAVPADPSVGVGRAAETDPNPELLNRRSDMDPAEKARIEAETRAKVEAEFKEKARVEAQQRADAEAAAKNTPDAVRARETERVNAILAAGDAVPQFGGPEVARACIKDSNATLETFNARMFEKMRGGKPSATAAPAQGAPSYGDGARVLYSHGALKAFRDLPIEGGGVMKAHEAAHRAGMWLAAAVYRKPWAIQYCKEHGVPMLMRDQETMQVRVMTENVLSAGGALVPIEMEAAIIMLRDSYGIARQLARTRAMQSDTLVIPRRTGGVTAYFFQDDDGTGITASDKGWDNVGLSAKKLGALTKVSKDLIEDAVISVVDDLAQEIAYAFAKKEDQCLIIGDGTSTYGGMTGINSKMEATAYASRIAAASGHDLPSEIDNADLTSVMGGISQYAAGAGAKWLCSNLIKSVIFGRLKATAGGNRVDTLGQAPNDEYLGAPIVSSEVMPSVITTLNAKVIALYGRFDMAASIGTRRGIEMQTLVERYAELGLIGVLGTERFDMNVHDLGTTSVKGPVAALYGN
jgi:HK97 family phage major capsid protein